MIFLIPAAAVVGPTASGKTAFAIQLAKYLNGEIISCDSMQIYKGLDIGTAKPTAEEQNEVPHHMIDFLEIDIPFSVSDYVNLAAEKLESVYNKGKLPIVVGGTGLYARSLLSGLSFEENCKDEKLRETLLQQAETEGKEALYEKLKEVDSKAAENIHPNNLKRVIRALEFFLVTGQKFSSQIQTSQPETPKYNYWMIGLAFRNRELLYDRINKRVDDMMEGGLLTEAKSLYDTVKSTSSLQTVLQAIGYKEIFPYFDGKISLDEAVENVKQGTRRYAKRQMTWFKKEKNLTFLYVDENNPQQLLEQAIILLEQKGIVKVK